MNGSELIEHVQSALDADLDATVRTRGGTEDERPVPAVILTAFDTTDLVLHNTHLAGVEETSAGQSDIRYYHYRYRARLDYEIRHADDFAASQLRDAVRRVFHPYVEDPRSFHPHIRRVRLRGGGGFSATSVEDQESEMTQAIQISTFEQTMKDDFDPLDSVEKDITATQ